MTIRLQYWNSPEVYRRPDSFYSQLVAQACEANVEIVDSKPDLVLQSVHPPARTKAARQAARGIRSAFGRRGRQANRAAEVRETPHLDQARTIWFTGENVRPPTGDWGATFSFDIDPLDGRNVYLPFWWETLGIVGRPTVSFTGSRPDASSLLHSRPTDIGRRSGFVCAFIGNPTRMRLHAIEALSQLGPVEVFGHSVGRPVAKTEQVARDFQFALCFENDLYPGYVTEKAIDAWRTGAIPLWWGLDPAGYLNQQALINAAETTTDELLERVNSLRRTPESLHEVASRPILTRLPDLLPALQAIRRVLATTG